MINAVFEYSGGKMNIVASEYSPINDVINRFLKKINKPELINDYKNNMKFLYRGNGFLHSGRWKNPYGQ